MKAYKLEDLNKDGLLGTVLKNEKEFLSLTSNNNSYTDAFLEAYEKKKSIENYIQTYNHIANRFNEVK